MTIRNFLLTNPLEKLHGKKVKAYEKTYSVVLNKTDLEISHKNRLKRYKAVCGENAIFVYNDDEIVEENELLKFVENTIKI